jgi:hypothetical protein
MSSAHIKAGERTRLYGQAVTTAAFVSETLDRGRSRPPGRRRGSCTTPKTRRGSKIRAHTKDLLRGFIIRVAAFMMKEQIHRVRCATDRWNRQSTSSWGSWFHDRGFMIAAQPPSSLVPSRLDRTRDARRSGPRLLQCEELRANRLPPNGGQSAVDSSGSRCARPLLPGGEAIRIPRSAN